MRRSIVFINIVLFFLAFAGISHPDDLRVYKGNLFYDTFFKDPVEKLIVIFGNGDFFYFTTSDESEVDVNGWRVAATLEWNGRDIKDAIIVIHNHPVGFARFTPGDINFLHTIENQGFKGKFLLYHQPSKTVIEYKK